MRLRRIWRLRRGESYHQIFQEKFRIASRDENRISKRRWLLIQVCRHAFQESIRNGQCSRDEKTGGGYVSPLPINENLAEDISVCIASLLKKRRLEEAPPAVAKNVPPPDPVKIASHRDKETVCLISFLILYSGMKPYAH